MKAYTRIDAEQAIKTAAAKLSNHGLEFRIMPESKHGLWELISRNGLGGFSRTVLQFMDAKDVCNAIENNLPL